MGIFTRISDIVSANLNALLDRAENPELMISQIIREMEGGLAEARRHAAIAIAAERRLGREAEQNRLEAEQWKGRARAALDMKREDLARRALVRKREHDELAGELQEQHAVALAASESVKSSLHAFEARLEEARRKQRSLLARHRAVLARHILEKRVQIAAPDLGVAQAKFERFENKIVELEDVLNARAEITFSLGRLDGEFARVENDMAIDRELEELKCEVKRTPAPAPPLDV